MWSSWKQSGKWDAAPNDWKAIVMEQIHQARQKMNREVDEERKQLDGF